jgi:alpha-ketoglutaric semialdehyde dehydrogenase
MRDLIPPTVSNFVAGEEHPALAEEWFPKYAPTTGKELSRVARSRPADIANAVRAAKLAQPRWADRTPVDRADVLREIALMLRARRDEIAGLVAAETGKSQKDALGEVGAAVEMGMFVAGEGRRFYGRTTTSALANKAAMTVRQPLGVAGLIIAGNTPIANVAWKVFPALLCGNAAVLKPAEETPFSAWAFARVARECGVPAGVLNVVHGFGDEAGAPLVESADVDVVSFTGSTEVGKYIARTAGARLAKVCLELGGKNPLIVCDDADLARAVRWAVLSAFSNAGQRCAAGSRIIVFDSIYEVFRERIVAATSALRIGSHDDDDFGPVISETQLSNMLAAVEQARRGGATILCGGHRLTGAGFDGGYFMAPTLIEGATPESAISCAELFGPISVIYRVRTFNEAIDLANASPYGLTAAVHTTDVNRAMTFLGRIKSGVAVVNGGTYGSEPHMPFGGLRESGNGFREAGTEALDVYSEWKTVYINFDPTAT